MYVSFGSRMVHLLGPKVSNVRRHSVWLESGVLLSKPAEAPDVTATQIDYATIANMCGSSGDKTRSQDSNSACRKPGGAEPLTTLRLP